METRLLEPPRVRSAHVSTLPIRNGNSSDPRTPLLKLSVSTLPIRNGNIFYNIWIGSITYVSTLPIRDGNSIDNFELMRGCGV